MKKRPVIQVFALGGTIAMTPAQGAGVVPSLSASDLVAAVPGLADVADVRAETLVQKGSANLDFKLIADICARAAKSDADGIVVTQGTDSMEESSFLASLLWGVGKPLVFTGAMRTPNQPGADGPANLMDAVTVAAHAPAGVYLVMNGEVHDPWRVSKEHTTSVGAFWSRGGPMGALVEGEIHWRAPVPARLALSRPEAAAFAPVALISACLDDDGRLLSAIAHAGYEALVVEAFGAGHLSEIWADKAVALAGHMPVIFASRAKDGRVLEGTYGYVGAEIDLIARGLVPAGGLSGRKARILLSLLLKKDRDGWRQAFTSAAKSV
ncbi:asparaginase [Kordiimonas marina]|uniref:asparaginase n=1 Tax=Kordiimonas marina TaxID=2872312 RepID=UPI001FF58BE1|nr:asparaginase [Kordiimonas marina]MCJ9429069.1 asparaginase [Kordiimonas marina]